MSSARRPPLSITAGKLFYSKTHQLTIDRQDLILSLHSTEGQVEDTKIFADQKHAYRNEQELKVERINSDLFTLDKSAAVAQLDFDALQFPLVWRRWKEGDYFTPLGMQQ